MFIIRASDWIGSVAKIGYVPLAPGTFCSMVAVLAWYVLPNMQTVTYGLILLNLFLVGVITSAVVSERDGDDDPSCVVIDEWVGMWLALTFVPKQPGWMIAAFLLFRFFDITKIPPAKGAEKLQGGWGIMLDDVIAGFYSMMTIGVVRAVT